MTRKRRIRTDDDDKRGGLGSNGRSGAHGTEGSRPRPPPSRSSSPELVPSPGPRRRACQGLCGRSELELRGHGQGPTPWRSPQLRISCLVEMGENRTPRPEPSRRELPTGISGLLALRAASPQPAGCFACYPAMPLGSLTPLTGVGDAAPLLMTSSRPRGERPCRRSTLFRRRERNYCCQLLALPAVLRGLRATSTCDSRSLSPVET
jgi:hypothetical protein